MFGENLSTVAYKEVAYKKNRVMEYSLKGLVFYNSVSNYFVFFGGQIIYAFLRGSKYFDLSQSRSNIYQDTALFNGLSR